MAAWTRLWSILLSVGAAAGSDAIDASTYDCHDGADAADCFCAPRSGEDCLGNSKRLRVVDILPLDLPKRKFPKCNKTLYAVGFLRVNRTRELLVGTHIGDRLATFTWSPAGTLSLLQGHEDPFAFLSSGTVDFEEEWVPAFVDWDGDGDDDMVLGAKMGQLRYFTQEVGGSFVERRGAANPFDSIRAEEDVSLTGSCQDPGPSFGDWDGDGDMDLILSEYCSKPRPMTVVKYFERLEGGRLVQRLGRDNPFQRIERQGEPAYATVHDVDGDGDLDLLFGLENQGIAYYERIAADSLLERVGQDHPFYGVIKFTSSRDVVRECLVSFIPSFVPFDGGHIDVVVPMVEGILALGLQKVHNLDRKISPFDNPFYKVEASNRRCWSCPAFVDWDADGDLDLIVSMYCLLEDSHVQFYERTAPFELTLLDAGSENKFMLSLDTVFSEDFRDVLVCLQFQDLDADGKVEMIATIASDNPWIFKNASLGWVRLQGPDDILKDLLPVVNDVDTESPEDLDYGRRAVFVDWDRDGDLDVITSDILMVKPLHFYRRTGPTSLLRLQGDSSPLGDLSGRFVAVVDWNEDGVADLVVGRLAGMDYYQGLENGGLAKASGSVNPFFVFDHAERPAPVFVDWDGDGDEDLVVGMLHGHLHFGLHSGCSQSSPCGFNGVCSPKYGNCSCNAGYRGGSCSICDINYYTADNGFPRQCAPCAGSFRVGQVCCDRGRCNDDESQRRETFNANGSITQVMLATGNGGCMCNDPDFGTHCCTGTCRPGREEGPPEPHLADLDGRQTGYQDGWTCKKCGSGKFSAAADRYWNGANSTEEVMPDSERAVCSPCRPGTYAAGVGLSNCSECTPGRYASDPGSSVCVVCPAGKFSGRPAQSECASCGPDSYAASEGASACDSCDGSALQIVDKDRRGCRTDMELLMWFAVIVLSQFVGWLAFCLRCGHKPRIRDVSRVGQKVFVTTAQTHSLLDYRDALETLSRGDPPTWIQLRDTGLDSLDDSWVLANAIDSTRLSIHLDHKKYYPRRLDSSMGFIVFPWTTQFCRLNVVGGLPICFMTLFSLITVIVVLSHITQTSFVEDRGKFGATNIYDDIKFYIAMGVLIGVVFATGTRRNDLTAPTAESDVAQYAQKHARFKERRRGPERGVELEDLLVFEAALAEHIRDRSCQYVQSNLVTMLTKPWKRSFAEVVGPKRMVYFVSYFSGMPFNTFLRSLERHSASLELADRGAYWAGLFSVNLWNLAAEGGFDGDWDRWQDASWYKALTCGSCRSTCVLIDIEVIPLTRSWCLFEVLQTYEMMPSCLCTGVVFCSPTGLIGSGQSYDIEVILAKRLEQLSITNARARRYSDYREISDLLLRHGGRAELMRRIREDLLQAAASAERRFEDLLRQCREPPAVEGEVLSDTDYCDAVIGDHPAFEPDDDGDLDDAYRSMCAHDGPTMAGQSRSSFPGLQSLGPPGLKDNQALHHPTGA